MAHGTQLNGARLVAIGTTRVVSIAISPMTRSFNDAERLPKPSRNFVVAEMLKKSHFDRLTLFRRQIGQYISHTRCLIVLLSGVRGALDGGCIGRGGGCLFSGGDHDS